MTSRGEDRVAEEERKRIERELTAARSSLRRREMAHNAAVNARVGRERELATLRGTLEVVTKENDRANDLSGPKAKVEAAKTEVAKKLEHAQSESDVSDRYDHIAARLIAANVELKRGTAALKADLADATADAASCEEYEREAMDAQAPGPRRPRVGQSQIPRTRQRVETRRGTRQGGARQAPGRPQG